MRNAPKTSKRKLDDNATKRKKRKTSKTMPNDNATKRKKRRTSPPRILDNGLLDLSCPKIKFQKIAQVNSKKSPLLRLPAELRTQIWKYALGGNTFNCLRSRGHPPFRRLFIPKFCEDQNHNQYNLLQTCRQICFEARQILYSHNTFRLRSWYNPFLRSNVLPVQVACIESIEVTVCHGPGYYDSRKNWALEPFCISRSSSLKRIFLDLIFYHEIHPLICNHDWKKLGTMKEVKEIYKSQDQMFALIPWHAMETLSPEVEVWCRNCTCPKSKELIERMKSVVSIYETLHRLMWSEYAGSGSGDRGGKLQRQGD